MLIVVMQNGRVDTLDRTWYSRVVRSSGPILARIVWFGTLTTSLEASTMTAKRRDPKGDARSATFSPPPNAGSPSSMSPVISSPSPHLPHVSNAGLDRNLATLCQRDDGWMRMVPDTDTQECFWKWKFTRGPHQGHYVMVRCMGWQYAYAVELLLYKLDEVDRGLRNPVLDRPYT